MNAPIDLISTDEVFAIAEDRGWESVNEIHSNLTKLAKEGHLRAWGYKGDTAQLQFIDPFTWQDHGLDMLNEQLIVPGRFLAPDYAEQTWREIRWDRHEIEAAFPPYTLVLQGSDPAPANPSGNGEDECRKWLICQMKQGRKQHNKRHYHDEASRLFGVGPVAFNRAWDAAKQETERWDWGHPGRRRKKS
jgi:hypothetical protein